MQTSVCLFGYVADIACVPNNNFRLYNGSKCFLSKSNSR